jgi:hypothetical protein
LANPSNIIQIRMGVKTEKSMTNKKDKGGWLFGSQSSTLSLLTSSASPQVFFSLCGPKKQARKAEEALLFLCVGCLHRKPTRRDINYSTTVCQHEEPSPHVVFLKSDAERSSPLQRVFCTRVPRQGTLGKFHRPCRTDQLSPVIQALLLMIDASGDTLFQRSLSLFGHRK